MPKRMLKAVLLAVLLAGLPRPALAVVATEATQLANHLELVKQLEQQMALVQQAIKHYQNLITNTNPLDSQIWSNALGEIAQVNKLLAEAKSLSFAAGNLDGQFSGKYRDYASYVASRIGDEQLSSKYQQWSEDTNASVLTTLKAAGLQAGQIEGDEEAYLRQLQDMAETTEGRMQALQLGNQTAIAGLRQTQKLRQLMLMQLQLQANYIQQQMDRDATQSAAWRNFTKKPEVSIGNGKRF